jgi:hypothetical protein
MNSIHHIDISFSTVGRDADDFIFGGCILLRSLLGLYYSGRQLQQSFYNKVFTHSHVSARAGHLQANIFFEACYCLLTDPLFGLSLHILPL